MQVRQDTQLAMTFPFVAFCHYSEQFPVSQAEQFSDGLCGQKHHYQNGYMCVTVEELFIHCKQEMIPGQVFYNVTHNAF